MLFNSWTFLPFIVVVLALYFALKLRGQNRMLLVASYVFYATWDWRFAGLLFATSAFDWACSRRIADASTPARARKLWVAASCTANLAVLGFFKYFNFFAGSLTDLLAVFGVHVDLGVLDVILPLGISFYTFQSMSYTIDVYRGEMPAIARLDDFLLAVSYFPHLIAGPIQRAARLVAQLTAPRHPTRVQWAEASWLIVLGFYKKTVMADNLAVVVDKTFDPAASPSALQWLFATYAFAWQIYGDFSGYSDMARGISKLMGIELMVNFDEPYIARDPSDFWRRWHISLSTWLRDYLYIPLGGSRGGSIVTYRNLMITMILGGLWHGASWTFVLWGVYHGVVLVIHRLLANRLPRLPAVVQIVLMFHVACFGWLLFRAKTLTTVVTALAAMTHGFHVDAASVEIASLLVLLAVPAFVVERWLGGADRPRGKLLGPVVFGLLLVAVVFLSQGAGQPFIYFQF